MTNKNKISWWKGALIGIGIGLSTIFPAKNAPKILLAQDICKAAPTCQVRTEIENTRIRDSDFIKSSLAVASCKDNEEKLRIYNYNNNNKEGENYTSSRIILPEFYLSGIDNKVIFFGTFGDKDNGNGVGLQSTHQKGDLSLMLNLEDTNRDNGTRTGGELDYTTGRLTPGIGYDNISISGENTDYVFGKIIFDKSENDQFGAGFRSTDSDKGNQNSLTGFWCHYGPEENWGTRTWATYDWNSNSETISFDSIIAQNPTFSEFSSPWIVGRGLGDMYTSGIVGDAGDPSCPLGNRTKQGFAVDISGSHTHTNSSGNNTGNIKAEAGYTFSSSLGNITPTAYARHDFDSQGNHINTNGAGLLYQTSLFGGNLSLETKLSETPSETRPSQIYTRAGFTKSF